MPGQKAAGLVGAVRREFLPAEGQHVPQDLGVAAAVQGQGLFVGCPGPAKMLLRRFKRPQGLPQPFRGGGDPAAALRKKLRCRLQGPIRPGMVLLPQTEFLRRLGLGGAAGRPVFRVRHKPPGGPGFLLQKFQTGPDPENFPLQRRARIIPPVGPDPLLQLGGHFQGLIQKPTVPGPHAVFPHPEIDLTPEGRGLLPRRSRPSLQEALQFVPEDPAVALRRLDEGGAFPVQIQADPDLVPEAPHPLLRRRGQLRHGELIIGAERGQTLLPGPAPDPFDFFHPGKPGLPASDEILFRGPPGVLRLLEGLPRPGFPGQPGCEKTLLRPAPGLQPRLELPAEVLLPGFRVRPDALRRILQSPGQSREQPLQPRSQGDFRFRGQARRHRP
ncbi:MAG: hypothetical protein BWY88_00581 [Synergistetes bacterium ADurb.Bin520]|nr:MAG: hypothetical protein BWY88_00581 [Synergistetes bacterium ADurb.Bin520]